MHSDVGRDTDDLHRGSASIPPWRSVSEMCRMHKRNHTYTKGSVWMHAMSLTLERPEKYYEICAAMIPGTCFQNMYLESSVGFPSNMLRLGHEFFKT